jgi:hypothetical protein
MPQSFDLLTAGPAALTYYDASDAFTAETLLAEFASGGGPLPIPQEDGSDLWILPGAVFGVTPTGD